MKTIHLDNYIINLDDVSYITYHRNVANDLFWLTFHMKGGNKAFDIEFNTKDERDKVFDGILTIMQD